MLIGLKKPRSWCGGMKLFIEKVCQGIPLVRFSTETIESTDTTQDLDLYPNCREIRLKVPDYFNYRETDSSDGNDDSYLRDSREALLMLLQTCKLMILRQKDLQGFELRNVYWRGIQFNSLRGDIDQHTGVKAKLIGNTLRWSAVQRGQIKWHETIESR